jgi:hypothetical protein
MPKGSESSARAEGASKRAAQMSAANLGVFICHLKVVASHYYTPLFSKVNKKEAARRRPQVEEKRSVSET